MVTGYFQLGDSRTVTSFFNLVRVHNEGAAFSFLAGASGWQRWLFTGIGRRGGRADPVDAALPCRRSGCSRSRCRLILGGAIGNLVDRIMLWHVVDFLQFHYGGWYFPSFNIADSAITIGACALILDELLRVRRAADKNTGPPPT
jgi:signal peptidase II